MIKNKGLRCAVSLAVPIMILALALLSALFFDSRRHMIVSLTAAAMTVVLFISGFEKKSTGTRRLVIVSVMTALCFLGRFIPILKPIMALTIITGIYLGGESGFLVGAMTAILTNFYFGQGPWTVFQMFAWGIAGYCAGMFSTMLNSTGGCSPLICAFCTAAGGGGAACVFLFFFVITLHMITFITANSATAAAIMRISGVVMP